MTATASSRWRGSITRPRRRSDRGGVLRGPLPGARRRTRPSGSLRRERGAGRPTKRERREIDRLRGRDREWRDSMTWAMGPPLQLRFVRSATELDQLPPTTAEVAFVGRSNVGKSSLLNALGGRKALAHVSKTPGRTQLLNVFALGRQRAARRRAGPTLMDCPGYGYAATSKAVRQSWGPMIERYLLGSRRAAHDDGPRRRRGRPDQARPADARLAAVERAAAHRHRHQARQGEVGQAARQAQAGAGRGVRPGAGRRRLGERGEERQHRQVASWSGCGSTSEGRRPIPSCAADS